MENLATGVSEIATIVMKVGAETAVPAIGSAVQVAMPIAETMTMAAGVGTRATIIAENTTNIAAPIAESTSDRAAIDGLIEHVGRLSQTGTPSLKAGEVVTLFTKPENDTDTDETAGDLKERLKNLIQELKSNPEYQAEIRKEMSEAFGSDVNTDPGKIEQKVFLKFAQEDNVPVAEQQRIPTNLLKEVHKLFENNSSDMRNFAKEEDALRKAIIREAKLREQNATPDQVNMVVKLVALLTSEYKSKVSKMVQRAHPEIDSKEALEKDPLFIFLKEAPNNLEAHIFLQEERKKSLAKSLFELLSMIIASFAKEVFDEVIPQNK